MHFQRKTAYEEEKMKSSESTKRVKEKVEVSSRDQKLSGRIRVEDKGKGLREKKNDRKMHELWKTNNEEPKKDVP